MLWAKERGARDKHVPVPHHPQRQPACGFLAGAQRSQVASSAELLRLPRILPRGTNCWSVLSSSGELQMAGKIFFPVAKNMIIKHFEGWMLG